MFVMREGGFFKKAGKVLKGSTSKAINTTKDFGKGITDTATNLGDEIVANGQNIFGFIGDSFQNLYNGAHNISDSFNNISNSLTNIGV